MPEINHKLLKKYLKDLSGDPAKQLSPVYLIFGLQIMIPWKERLKTSMM
jgi:hypothetical protein